MLLSEVSSPIFPAPEGIQLGDGVKISYAALEDNGFSISGIRIRNDCSIVIELSTAPDLVGNIIRYASRRDGAPLRENEYTS